MGGVAGLQKRFKSEIFRTSECLKKKKKKKGGGFKKINKRG